MGFVRRVRGAIGMGIMWALACGAIGGAARWILGVDTDAPLPVLFGMFGFAAGITFATILALAARRRSFEEMSLPRFALLGAVGGAALAVAFTSVVVGVQYLAAVAPAFAAASAVIAAGSLALARRGARQKLSAADRDRLASPQD